ncbi:hypothetical protein VXJ69_005385, partial [Salmonella enterica]|nr:hypothetical protein [Salmonella enterica]EME0708007.1 hypothetical protein [Salmonella enterica]
VGVNVPHEYEEFGTRMICRVKAVCDGVLVGYLVALYDGNVRDEGDGERNPFAVFGFRDQFDIAQGLAGLSF